MSTISKPVMVHQESNFIYRPAVKSEVLPQEMLKRMVVYQTAFRQVKGYLSCVCDSPHHSLSFFPL